MKIVYIAAQFPLKDEFIKKASKVMPQYAADHVSRLFCEGIMMQDNINIEVINVVPIAPWPTGSSKFIIPRMDWKEQEHVIEGVSYCNAIGIRQYSKYSNLKRICRKKISTWSNDETYVVAYGITTPILKIFKYLKQVVPQIKTCLIVPDLPQYMNEDGGALYHFLKNIDIKKQKKLYKYVDGMVYFSKHMNDFFGFDDDKWMVIEGLVDYNECMNKVKSYEESEKKIVLYSGSIEISYGINDLLDAFMMIEGDEYQLRIIGGGNGVPAVLEAAEKDKRVKYMGVMERGRVLQYQQEATVLVNPRKSAGIFTKYSFPSKTLEYMMAGAPVLMHRLEGIPDEYDQYLTYFTSNDLWQMAHQLKNLCDESIDQRYLRANRALKFVRANKNNKEQMAKLCHFIRKM